MHSADFLLQVLVVGSVMIMNLLSVGSKFTLYWLLCEFGSGLSKMLGIKLCQERKMERYRKRQVFSLLDGMHWHGHLVSVPFMASVGLVSAMHVISPAPGSYNVGAFSRDRLLNTSVFSCTRFFQCSGISLQYRAPAVLGGQSWTWLPIAPLGIHP